MDSFFLFFLQTQIPPLLISAFLSAFITASCCCQKSSICEKKMTKEEKDEKTRRFDLDNDGTTTQTEVIQGIRYIRWMSTVKASILIILCIYPGLATRTFSIFLCEDVNDVHVLHADYNIECWSENHLTYVFLALGFISLYIIGIPALILIVLWRNRAYLHHPHKDPNNKKLIKLAMSAKWEKKHESADLLLGGLFKQYGENDFFYFFLFSR